MEGAIVANPLVSVVIPCYRQAHFLPEAIESALLQTYPHVEIIVVDDGSPDDTSAVAARYPKVRCVRQPNRGLSAARNSGLRASAGEYLVFLDADDRLTVDALRSGVREMALHPECAFAAGEHGLIDEKGTLLPSMPRPQITSDHYREFLKTNFIWCPANVIYRRSVFAAVGAFDTSLTSGEDYDLYLRIARRFPVRTHQQIVAQYRAHRGSMSRNPGRMLGSTVKILRAQREHLNGDPALEAACASGIRGYQKLYGLRLISQIAVDMRVRRWRRVVRESLVALRYCPGAFAAHARDRVRRTIVGVLN
jgi:glycosyltransferase involved in cell wall biosynthesis